MPLPRAAAVVFFFWLGVLAAWAHPPIPASVLDPRTPPEAWNVLRLATANIDQLLRENRLAEISDQVSLCSPALRALARSAPAGPADAVAARTVHAGAEVDSVAQAAMAGDRAATATAFEALRTDLHALAGAFDPAVVNADVFFCPMHPDFLSTGPGACARCGMALQLRRVPYSFIYTRPGEPTVRLAVTPDAPLLPGREAHVTLRLSLRDGTPVRESDLEVTHTRPIHLLIVDPALEDYHHEHPVPTTTPGEYTFSFVPAKDTSYRVFADVVPLATGVQEYPFADLPGTANAPRPTPPGGESTTACEAGGLRFILSSDLPDGTLPRAREVHSLQIQVIEADGKPTRRLEPVMNAFAHLVGFYDDGHTVLHLHPQGGEITDPAQRGGPTLEFRFYPPKAGFVRLFCQVQIGGRAVYAPFNVNVAP